MIQEKDFLYRVPVKTAPITTPKGQIRNPEILVDIEGGEFMHGNILDANSTNKLINQSVKKAVDNKLIEGGYVTKGLLDAETSARTNGDEDLSTKIKAEQTRAEGKEKEISDKLAIVDGDSNTEGSFRKAIADVIAAAPEDLDTLKEIADKLADNDDLYTVLNQAITEKADATALEGAKTELDEKINNLKFIPYDPSVTSSYQTDKQLAVKLTDTNTATLNPDQILMKSGDSQVMLKPDRILVQKEGVDSIFDWNLSHLRLGPNGRNVKIGPTILSNGGAGILIDEGYTIATYLQSGELNLAGSSGFNTKYCYDKIQSSGSIISFTENSIRGFEIETPGISGTISSAIEDIRSTKQDKITVNSVDVTDIETADIAKLRTIVKDLLEALDESGLIRRNINIE